PHLESLRIVRLAAQSRDRHVESGRLRRDRQPQEHHRRTSGSPRSSASPRLCGEDSASGQTTPHFLLNSHSDARIPSASRKITGMSHKSRVSRVVIPASEYEISFVNLDASSGL